MKSGLKRWVGGTAATLVLMGTFAIPRTTVAQEEHHHHWDADDDANWGNGPAGYNTYYRENGTANYAARHGYAAGYEQGESDRYNRHSYRPTHTDAYHNVPDSPHGMDHHTFVRSYREAFIRGYERGYRRG